jgi:phage-related protein
MIYFVIPTYSGGPPTSQTIYVDNGVSVSYQAPKRVSNFGDGYSLSIPTGPIKRTFQAVFSNRPTTELNYIDNYFAYKKGGIIVVNIMGTNGNFEVIDWGKSYINQELTSLQATFTETFR